VKRGLLLHGPPGTGKTHTVRYLLARTHDHTVIVLTGGGLQWIRAAVGLAASYNPPSWCVRTSTWSRRSVGRCRATAIPSCSTC
jgi:hypothetical protein